MTFLELVQAFWREAGLSGPGPQAVTNQRGMERKAVDWVANAWTELQGSRRDWRFLRRTVAVPLLASQRDYTIVGTTLAPGFAPDWRFPCYDKGAALVLDGLGQVSGLEWLDWPTFRSLYGASVPPANRPQRAVEVTSDTLRLDCPPDQGYSMQLEYIATPQRLKDNQDVPNIKEHLQMVIAWKALQTYCGNDSASELFQIASTNFAALRSQLVLEEVPPVTNFAGRLA